MTIDGYGPLTTRSRPVIILNDSTEQTVELLFTCLDTHGCPIEGEEVEVSFLGSGPASTDREVPVSRVILGTPYFVQFTRASAKNPTGEEGKLLTRFKDYFREKYRSP